MSSQLLDELQFSPGGDMLSQLDWFEKSPNSSNKSGESRFGYSHFDGVEKSCDITDIEFVLQSSDACTQNPNQLDYDNADLTFSEAMSSPVEFQSNEESLQSQSASFTNLTASTQSYDQNVLMDCNRNEQSKSETICDELVNPSFDEFTGIFD